MARITAKEKQVLHSNIHSLCSGAAIEAWEKIRADIKETRPIVRPNRAVQQRKVAIWPCESSSPCEDRGSEHNCNFRGSCSAKGHTATFA